MTANERTNNEAIAFQCDALNFVCDQFLLVRCYFVRLSRRFAANICEIKKTNLLAKSIKNQMFHLPNVDVETNLSNWHFFWLCLQAFRTMSCAGLHLMRLNNRRIYGKYQIWKIKTNISKKKIYKCWTEFSDLTINNDRIELIKYGWFVTLFFKICVQQ